MMFAALPPEINSARRYTGPGPGSMLGAAAVPYLVWLNATAEQATQTSGQAEAAIAAYEAAYEAAYAMTVPPALIATNRAQLATLTQLSARAMTTSESRLELPTLRILPEAVGS